MELPKKLQQKLETRKEAHALRKLGTVSNLVDFSSNDYLGFSKNETVFNNAHDFLMGHNMKQNGATGSRLLSGNHPLFHTIETILSEFHQSESALIFNSGYDANVGFFSSVPQRGDVILYDEYIHASIRDGIQLSNAKAYKFKHNDLGSLDEMLKRIQHDTIYVVTESVFSMDGDSPDLAKLSQISKENKAYLIIDEAHAMGVFGKRGVGLVLELGLENDVFARLVTFGKAMGCHGAAILGSDDLKQYLVNFARSFIYTTALSPHSLATVHAAYNELVISNNNKESHPAIKKLHSNISFFKAELVKNNLNHIFIESDSAIHCCIISGNETVKSIAKNIQEHSFDVKPILSPTVPQGQERLRFCLHAFNSKEEITEVLKLLATFVNI
ncbi:8-amino-7-oxononanoate synthase [Mariniflexile rhizosphaerae]|uniref:aminotransferase class I/II-fold pyridoxal phosphate-dependent enzyme n=1 Tax=unclassified Mariniflexile TaxID=2643887 RepID=UPI000CAF0DF2|nr:8-amino-7-oxononanoate synthase [Mariniflexile sp. TRM1-10]AXP80389.1 8-amino-7-oxononanoate synthase [Mariniflexile sp. TRM1-10]PLB20592.1 MAG: 8-amino-7-oxononanoate synthase [Flavobacteriaceae bacterium FS1-H7996/R]